LTFDRDLDCIAEPGEPSLPVHAVRPSDLEAFLAAHSEYDAFVRQSGFAAEAGAILLLPGAAGLAGAVFGLGAEAGPHVFGALPFELPPGAWRLAQGEFAMADAVLGFCLGAYSFNAFKAPPRAPHALRWTDKHTRLMLRAPSGWLATSSIRPPAIWRRTISRRSQPKWAQRSAPHARS